MTSDFRRKIWSTWIYFKCHLLQNFYIAWSFIIYLLFASTQWYPDIDRFCYQTHFSDNVKIFGSVNTNCLLSADSGVLGDFISVDGICGMVHSDGLFLKIFHMPFTSRRKMWMMKISKSSAKWHYCIRISNYKEMLFMLLQLPVIINIMKLKVMFNSIQFNWIQFNSIQFI
jgi:hypothetical protein